MNAPWGLESRTKLVIAAVAFFNISCHSESCEAIGKTPRDVPEALSLPDFMTYLEVKKVFSKPPNAFRVMQLLERMSSAGLLINVGDNFGKAPIFRDRYFFVQQYPGHRDKGFFRFAAAIGNDFLFRLMLPVIVQITGVSKEGNVRAGTGMILGAHHILTCRHVLDDMKVDTKQNFQGIGCSIDGNFAKKHDQHDLAVIYTDAALEMVEGLVFQPPVVSQNVYTIGYPKIPLTRSASLTMQPGSVTNESVESFRGEALFLYSAIARPGNSGGPVISHDGYIVGMTTKDLTLESGDNEDSSFSPHYAGIPSQVIVEAVDDLGVDVQIPFASFE